MGVGIDHEVFAGDLSRPLAIGSGPQQPVVLPPPTQCGVTASTLRTNATLVEQSRRRSVLSAFGGARLHRWWSNLDGHAGTSRGRTVEPLAVSSAGSAIDP